ncbi:DNA mismatch repair protein MutL [Methanocorpusculum labreanum Z]|uniref:DNA mismatch repair protein MutL n=1 Tax=Methanocorpusculum labreanum (strain ATCC 43576 / DSM 4855 / Z) TaxID=410358 RepID=MUTL_METLZ|nr:DNA mismatch repair endonuclease MutL [Methanocorpusculum labreanum]A2SSN1.1 RecName: Full=DNA mismatch repair protein MutL [Methanocorpusculum labreanum Z]ABN07337.1 DNA mismatch repair protein MutL [Methanocorpusculum labreanum Z]
MSRVKILDEETISHIAAGEVVERAASVVKELVENAVDADAQIIRIGISADKTGITKISVTDDGIGMDFDDALLAFRQHATSKISRPEDLDGITTLGFRGEALASIAAISKVTFTTKERGSPSPEAARVVIHGGELISHSAVGAPEGTSVLIDALFYNTPARRKFQKSVPTELSHVYDMVERIALSNRNISFVLLYNGKERFQTFGTGSYPDVIAAVFGSTFSKELTPVSGSFGPVKIDGWITRPGSEMKTTQTRFYLSINGRQVTSRQLQWAIREGYGTLLPKGMYPAAFLDIVLDPRDVDVNVHPTKREVRLSREREVMRCVQDAVYTSLHEERVFSTAPMPTLARETITTLPVEIVGEPVPVYAGKQEMHEARQAPLKQTEKQLRRTESADLPETDLFVPEVLGQIGDTYILAKNESGDLIVVDQHAAHERIMYDQLLARSSSAEAGQELIVPQPITLSKKETAALPDLLDVLAAAGYLLEPFGKDVWMVRSVPVVSSTLGDPDTIHAILDAALDGVGNTDEVLDRVLKTAACRAVVKGNTPLTIEQMQRLLRQLMATKSPYTCPHGRPTTIVLSKSRLAGMFLRT